MSIEETDPRLTAYVFGELSGEEQAALEAELASDAAARARLAEIRSTFGVLQAELLGTKPPQLEAGRRQKIAHVLDQARRKKRGRLLWGAAALSGAAASLLLLTTVLRGGNSELGYMSAPRENAPLVLPTDAAPVTAPVDEVAAKPLPALPPRPEPLPRAAAAAAPAPLPPAPQGLAAAPARRPLAYDGSSPGFAYRETENPRPAVQPKPSLDNAVRAAASVSAGEWDDNANYREFMRWLATEPAPAAHRIDVRDRRFLVVRDTAGLGVPGCRVLIADESDRQTELITAATGRAILFPHAEGLAGRMLTASTDCAGGARKHFSLSGADGVVELRTSERRALPMAQIIDVAFILDSTGSMAEEIAAVKTTIQKVASGLRDSNVRIRIGLVEFKDRGDPFVTRIYPMSTDLERFSAQIASVQADGGGDTPESGNEALHVGIKQLAWSDAALAKLAFLVGDAPPHLDYPDDYDYALEARAAAHRGIQVYTVAASGMDLLGQVVWRQVAQYTGGTNLFVLRGGAGPQSAGAGDPKSSCGGTQTAYTSGNLDALVLAKINGAIRSLQRDPLRIPGLNVDENAKPCADRLSIAQ